MPQEKKSLYCELQNKIIYLCKPSLKCLIVRPVRNKLQTWMQTRSSFTSTGIPVWTNPKAYSFGIKLKNNMTSAKGAMHVKSSLK